MLKHIGRTGDRKIAIVFREIPNEEHMCLVIYPDVLPTHIHNSVMSVLESAPGQQATNLADVFHRNLLPDGRNILQTLHREGMLKKIATNQVILTPTATSSVKLDEINRLVKEMESGTEALKRMQEIDQSAGMVAPEVKRQAEAEAHRKAAEEAQRTGIQGVVGGEVPLPPGAGHHRGGCARPGGRRCVYAPGSGLPAGVPGGLARRERAHGTGHVVG